VTVEEIVKEVFNKVLDIKPDEIRPEAKLDEALGVDSTEMVEIAVGLKKALNIAIDDNELKKTHSYNEIIGILKSKGAN
jgi:acyl carrier protein